jgi:hypothetical protein
LFFLPILERSLGMKYTIKILILQSMEFIFQLIVICQESALTNEFKVKYGHNFGFSASNSNANKVGVELILDIIFGILTYFLYKARNMYELILQHYEAFR